MQKKYDEKPSKVWDRPKKKENGGEDDLPSRKKRNSGTETISYLKEKSEKELEFKKEVLSIKRLEIEHRKEQQTQLVESQRKMFEQMQSQQLSFQRQIMIQQNLLFDKFLEQQQQSQQMQVNQVQQQKQQNQLLVKRLEKIVDK